MYVLSLDTSTDCTSVSLGLYSVSQGVDLSSLTTTCGASRGAHAEELSIVISELIDQEGLSIEDLGAIVLGTGPGSFTGLRIGTAYAKGLCLGLSIPLFSFCSFRAVAYVESVRDESVSSHTTAVLGDARRGEFFVGMYSAENGLSNEGLVCAIEPCIMNLTDLSATLDAYESKTNRKIVVSSLLSEPLELVGREVRQASSDISMGHLYSLAKSHSGGLSFDLDGVAAVSPRYVRGVTAKTLKERGVIEVDRSYAID